MKNFSAPQLSVMEKYNFSADLPSSIFMGPVGTGKTTALTIFENVYNVKILRHDEIISMYQKYGHGATEMIINSTDCLILDDILNISVNSFGTVIENVYEVLLKAKIDKMDVVRIQLEKVESEILSLETAKKNGTSKFNDFDYNSFLSSRMQARENWLKASTHKLYISTNLTVNQFKESFSSALIDRIKCNLKTMALVGKSNRKPIEA